MRRLTPHGRIVLEGCRALLAAEAELGATDRELRVAHHIAYEVETPGEHRINPADYPLSILSLRERVVLVRGTTCFLVERVR